MTTISELIESYKRKAKEKMIKAAEAKRLDLSMVELIASIESKMCKQFISDLQQLEKTTENP